MARQAKLFDYSNMERVDSEKQKDNAERQDAHDEQYVDGEMRCVEPVAASSRHTRRWPTAKQLMAVLENQEFRCALTGVPLTPRTCEIDHKVPIARGGTNDIDNVWFIDRTVNRAKHTMTIEEFRAMCQRVIEWTR